MSQGATRARGQGGFTMVELMITVGLVGVLASIAIPNYTEMQLKARRTEPYLILDGIQTQQLWYQAQYDKFITASTNPGGTLNKEMRDWRPTLSRWDDLGYAPDGQVRCNYAATVLGSDDEGFRLDATCDLDDDNRSAIVRYYWVPYSSATGYYIDAYPERY